MKERKRWEVIRGKRKKGDKRFKKKSDKKR
jgi:hypothetical protein